MENWMRKVMLFLVVLLFSSLTVGSLRAQDTTTPEEVFPVTFIYESNEGHLTLERGFFTTDGHYHHVETQKVDLRLGQFGPQVFIEGQWMQYVTVHHSTVTVGSFRPTAFKIALQGANLINVLSGHNAVLVYPVKIVNVARGPLGRAIRVNRLHPQRR